MFNVGDITTLLVNLNDNYKKDDEVEIVAKYPGRIMFYDIQKTNIVGCPIAKKIPEKQLRPIDKK